MIKILPLRDLAEIVPDDDLATLLLGALRSLAYEPRAGDVLVVTQKIVSKAEGLFVRLDDIHPGPRALELAQATKKDARFVELVLAESTDIVRAVPGVLITRHRSGHVMANAGIDRSNIGPGEGDWALLLPADADRSAAMIREALRQSWEEPPAVVISDSFGRPWRYGVVNVAIGASGMPALIDRRGARDRDGRTLEVTQVALADLVAAAAGLAMGEAAEGIPAAIVRGIAFDHAPRPAAALVRPVEEDLFR